MLRIPVTTPIPKDIHIVCMFRTLGSRAQTSRVVLPQKLEGLELVNRCAGQQLVARLKGSLIRLLLSRR